MKRRIRFDPPLGSTWQVRPGRRKRRTAQPASGHLSTAASKDMPLHLTLEIALQSSFNMPRSSYNCLTALYIYIIIYHLTSFRYNSFRLSELATHVARLHRKPQKGSDPSVVLCTLFLAEVGRPVAVAWTQRSTKTSKCDLRWSKMFKDCSILANLWK